MTKKMEQQEVINVLTIRFMEGIGDVNGRRLIEFFGSAGEVLRQNRRSLERVPGIGRVLAGKFDPGSTVLMAEKEMEYALRQGIRVIPLPDPDYPESLRHCHDAPLVLFLRGSPVWKDKRLLSVVGTRMMTPYGRDFIRKFMKEAGAYDPLIVSGMAYGVDVCAHETALQDGLGTLGVLAHGLDTLYPALHRKVAEKMLKMGGLVSEFPSGTRPEKMNFVRRNRLIAGLSQATVVVESARKGGSLITADLALSYHREVFALPGRHTDLFSRGCNELIRDNKAGMITCFADLARALCWEPTEKVKEEGPLICALGDKEKLLLDHLKRQEDADVDQLSISCCIPMAELSAVLLQLEIRGLICRRPGNRFRRI